MELNKKETAERLGVTTRAVERYMGADRPLEQRLVPVRYQSGRGGQQPVFDSDQVDEFKRRMTEAAQEKREAPKSEALALRPSGELLQLLADALKPKTESVSLDAKMFLTIRESSELSGLSQREIKEAVRNRDLPSRRGRRGSLVVHRESLEKWARKLK